MHTEGLPGFPPFIESRHATLSIAPHSDTEKGGRFSLTGSIQIELTSKDDEDAFHLGAEFNADFTPMKP